MGPKGDHKAWNEDLVRALRCRYNNAVTAKTASGSNTARDVAKVQVSEGKQTQFRYAAAIERIEAVGKDIYTFANGRIYNLPGTEKIGGKAALPGCSMCACTAPVSIRMLAICSPYPRRMRADHPRRGSCGAASQDAVSESHTGRPDRARGSRVCRGCGRPRSNQLRTGAARRRVWSF